MTELSPAAQAVLDAFTEDNSLHDWKVHIHHLDALAAALRAAADQLGYCRGPDEFQHLISKIVDVDDLLAIAAELEGQ